MRNPWLDIPAADYLGHMSSPEVGQLSVLSGLFRESLERYRPVEVLLLGCSTGNGLTHVDPSVTRRVVGIDINREYLAQLADQFPNPGFELRLECEDVMEVAFEPNAFDLVHCGLLFEYIEWPGLIPALARTIRVGGILSVVLQCPDVSPVVTRTNYSSLHDLERIFQFVDPPALRLRAHAFGLELDSHRHELLRSGRLFEVMNFRKIIGSASTK